MNTFASMSQRTNVWAVAELLTNAQPEMNIMNLAGQKAQSVPKKVGDTIVFRRYKQLPINVNPLTEGTTTDNYNQLTFEDFSVQLKQYGGFTDLSDAAELLHEDPLMAQALQLEGEQAGQTVETLGWNVLSAIPNVLLTGDAQTIATVVKPFTIDTIRDAVRFLESNNAPKIKELVDATPNFGTSAIPASYFALIHPDLKKDLRKMGDDYIPVEKYGHTMDRVDNECGATEEIRFLTSTIYAPKLGTGGVVTDNSVRTTTVGADKKADLYSIVVLARDAFATVAIKGMWAAEINVSADIATRADPYKSARTISWKMWYALVVTNPRNLIRIVTASAR